MDKADALSNLLERLLTAIETPIAHSYGYIELLQHDLHKDEVVLQNINEDVEKIKVHLNRIMLYLEDFSEEYDQLNA